MHTALLVIGCIDVWLGLDTYEDKPGYKHIRIEPHIRVSFNYVDATLQTNYGRLSNAWKMDSTTITMDVEIPANTTASIYLPSLGENNIYEGGKKISAVKDIKITGKENGYVIAQVGSGKYHFVIKK